MQKVSPQIVPTGDVDAFLVEVLGVLAQHNERVAAQPGLDESLHVDVLDLVLDLLGVPVNRYDVDDRTGNCEMPADGYCRDWLHDIAREGKDKADRHRFIQAARAEGSGGLMAKMAKAVAAWDQYRQNSDEVVPSREFFDAMNVIGQELARLGH